MSSFEFDDLSHRPSPNQAKKGLVMDIALVLLGGSTIWLATNFLSFSDARPLFNAWTYVVAIPLGLLAVDMLLRTVVTRFVERSLQVAFLLSMLVHLVMTMSAINVVLFAHSESQLPNSTPSTRSAQERPSSVPEYFQTSENQNATKPDYLKPVATAEVHAAESETIKQSLELPATMPALAETPDTKIETPQASLSKVESKLDEPEIKSEQSHLDRPELAAAIPESSNSIKIPEAANLSKLDDPTPLEAAASDLVGAKSKSKTSLDNPRFDRLEPSSLATVEPRLDLSKSPSRRRQDNFELPSIEDHKTDLAKHDLSPKSASRFSELSPSRVPLIDLPKSADGDLSSNTPSATLDKPSEVGDISPTLGNRKLDSTRGGSISSAALEDWAEAGALSAKAGGVSTRSVAPSLARRPGKTEQVQISDSSIATPRSKPSSRVAPPTQAVVPLPTNGGPATQENTGESTAENLAASNVGSTKRPSTSSKSGSGDTLRGLPLGLNEIQPSVDMKRSSNLAIAAAGGRKGNALELEPSFDLPGLQGPKRSPRLPSARPTPNAPAVPIPAPAFQQRMARNDGSADSSELGDFGPATEAAIERGLEFLAKNQRADGSWQLEDFGDRPRLRSHTAATALSLLAFQGAGYSHRQYHYAPVCRSALEFLISHQKSDGDLYIPTDEASNANARFYSHSIASLALCEAYGMTQDEALREPSERAVQFMVKSQDPVGGGWRYQPGFESDTSVSGWFMMALKSAELSGLKVPQSTFDGIKSWLEKAQASPEEPHLYRYNPLASDITATRHGRIPNPTMTGVGLLMRLYLGWRRDTPEMIRGADYLLENLPVEGTALNPKRDTYYWYYATQVLFHMGGERWKRWNSQLHPMLIKSQELEGDQVGSWNPSGPVPDRWGPFAGRLYVTTLNLLSLEVYYRHLPIYEETAK